MTMNTQHQTDMASNSSLTAHVGAMVSAQARLILGLLGVAACVSLMALAAQVRIPVPGTDVPMTLQLAAVLLTGFLLTPPRAVATMLVYLALGGAGLPVFTPGSAGLLGPTGGYLVGFVAAACLVSVLKGSPRASVVRLLMAGMAGVIVVFVVAIAWRTVLMGDLRAATATGLLPFVPKALVEVGCAVTMAKTWRSRSFMRRPQM